MRVFLDHMARKSGSFLPNVPEFKNLRYQVLEKRATFSDKAGV